MPQTVRQNLQGFLEELDRYRERIPLEVLARLLQSLQISVEDVREHCCYGERTYRRNLMHTGPAYQALILCWKNGQRSPIHDHRGSSCGVKVLEGVATETTFTSGANGMIVASSSRELGTFGVCATQDADIHQMSNLQAGDACLVTLHVYSPPLARMGTYSLTDPVVREFDEPIYENCHGAGI